MGVTPGYELIPGRTLLAVPSDDSARFRPPGAIYLV